MASVNILVKHAAGPNLLLVALLLSLAYAGDLALTATGHHFYSTKFGTHELNPAVSASVDAGTWWWPVLFKTIGLALLWTGVFILGPTPYRGRYSWLLGGFAVLYLMLDLYQLVTIHALAQQ